jgi:cytochrome c-type biogenesis protein CcmE
MSDQEPREPSVEDEGVAVPRRRRDEEPEDPGAQRRRVMFVIPLVAGAAALVAVFLGGMKDNAIYSKGVDELVKDQARFLGRSVRAEGNLVHGSLMKRDSPCEYRFTITKNKVDVPVRYAQCVVPDTFRDVPGMDVGVTVEGQLQPDGSFVASSVLAKCPSKYEMKERAQKGETMPHGAMEPEAMQK